MCLQKCHLSMWLSAALAVAAGTAVLRADSILGTIGNSLDDQRKGFQIYGFTVGTGYYSAFVPEIGSQSFVPGIPTFGADVSTSMIASLGYRWHRPTSNFEIIYSPTYYGSVRNSQFNTLNHQVSITGARPFKLGERLKLSFHVQGGVTNYQQFLFSPGLLDALAPISASFPDLSAVVANGQLTNTQIATMLTGSSAVASPAQFLFYGDRMLTATLASTLSYLYSPRLSISLTLGATRYQHLNGNMQADSSQSAFLLPQATAGDASVNVSYSLSPRTQFGVDLGTSRNFSRFQEGFSSTGRLNLRRKMGQRWLASGNVGIGMINTVGGKYNTAAQPLYILGGMAGFKTYAHAFTVNGERTITNSFGVAYNTTDITATWIWRPGNRAWIVSTQGGYQKLSDVAASQIDTGRASTSLGRRVGSHLTAQVSFVYVTYSGTFTTTPYNLSQRGVLLSLTWVPANVVQ